MIKIEVIHSHDTDLIGEFTFLKNLIYIGNTIGDLRVNTPKIYNQHLFIEIVDNKLIAHPNKEVDFYLVDGKRTTNIKILKRGSTIDLDVIKFRIVDFQDGLYLSTKETINQQTDILINLKHPILEQIQKLRGK